MPETDNSIASQLTAKFAKNLDFNTSQLNATFADVLEALTVNLACTIFNNARNNRADVVKLFHDQLDRILTGLENDQAVEAGIDPATIEKPSKQAQSIFGIAITKNVCHGHGDYGDVQYIQRGDGYFGGEFPPFFSKEEDAREFLSAQTSATGDPKIVKLTLR